MEHDHDLHSLQSGSGGHPVASRLQISLDTQDSKSIKGLSDQACSLYALKLFAARVTGLPGLPGQCYTERVSFVLRSTRDPVQLSGKKKGSPVARKTYLDFAVQSRHRLIDMLIMSYIDILDPRSQ